MDETFCEIKVDNSKVLKISVYIFATSLTILLLEFQDLEVFDEITQLEDCSEFFITCKSFVNVDWLLDRRR